MKITIITPVYNRQDSLSRCLDSVIAQLNDTDFEIEQVVVDDGSTDSSGDIIREYANKYGHIKPIYFAANRGVNAARNTAIEKATGQWIFFLDSDNMLVSNALASISEAIGNYHGYKMLVFAIDYRATEFGEPGSVFEMTFYDFLGGKYCGDFIQVVDASIMKQYPFEEHLMIYEGITFMRMYKAIGSMLAINTVVEKMEICRPDSVSRSYWRKDDTAIRRKRDAALLTMNLFKDDYIKAGLVDKLDSLYVEIVENALLLGDYSIVKQYIGSIKHGFRRHLYRTIMLLGLNGICKSMLQCYLDIRYK